VGVVGDRGEVGGVGRGKGREDGVDGEEGAMG